MPGSSYGGPLPPLSPEERLLRDRLAQHVEALAARIGERNLWHYAELREAERYIREEFAAAGYSVRAQSYVVGGHGVSNLEVRRRGTETSGGVLVIGAHYDSVRGSPGANDNATGVAALIEIARLLAGAAPVRELRFVAFVNEEPPFSYTSRMGSVVYAREAARRGERVAGMLSLETLGYYSDTGGSQRYPFPFGLFYPDTGNFVGFVGNLRSRALVRRVVGSFRRHTRFPSEGTAAPGWLPGIGWSDHWSFWRQGWPAVMVTDTALFRYREYHSASDTPDVVDYERLARVVAGLARVVEELSGVSR